MKSKRRAQSICFRRLFPGRSGRRGCGRGRGGAGGSWPDGAAAPGRGARAPGSRAERFARTERDGEVRATERR